MPQHLSDDELRRISAFADRPMYEREPEQLMPEGAEDDDADRRQTNGT